MLNLINIEYDKMIRGGSEYLLNLKLNDNISEVSFLGLDPQCIGQISPRHYNPSIELPSGGYICEESIEPIIKLENIESGQFFDFNSSLDYNPGLYFLTFQHSDSELYQDSGSVYIKRPVNIDIASPSIYQDVYNSDLSIDPLPGINELGEGHDITLDDEIHLSVSDGPNYFSDTNVLNESGYEFPFDLSYAFNNKIRFEINGYLNDSDENLVFDGSDSIYYDETFYADLNRVIIREWLDIDEDESGKLRLNIKVIDNAGNESIDDFIYQLQSQNLNSLNNFFNYPNPFSAVGAQKTSFRYSLANQLQSGTLKVYDIAGRLLYNYKLNDSSEIINLGWFISIASII